MTETTGLPRTPAGAGGEDLALGLMVFTRQFALLMETGRSLVKCFEAMAESTPEPYPPGLRAVLADICEGATLSRSMAQHLALFPPVFVRLVRVGEVGGMLDETMNQAADLLEEEWQISRWSQEPASLQVLSRALAYRAEEWSALWDVQQKMTVLLFCRLLALLLSAGVPLYLCLDSAAELLPRKEREGVQALWLGDRSKPVAEPLAQLGFLPELVIGMIADVESSRPHLSNVALHSLMERAAQFYRYEMQWRLGGEFPAVLPPARTYTADPRPWQMEALEAELGFFQGYLGAVGASPADLEILGGEPRSLFPQVSPLLHSILIAALREGAEEIQMAPEGDAQVLQLLAGGAAREIRRMPRAVGQSIASHASSIAPAENGETKPFQVRYGDQEAAIQSSWERLENGWKLTLRFSAASG